MVSETNSTVTSWCFPLTDNRVIAPDAAAIARFPASFANIFFFFFFSLCFFYFFTGSFTFSCVCPGGNANPSTASLKRTTTLSGVISALFTFTKALMTAFATSLRTSGVRHAFGSLRFRDNETRRRVVVVDSFRSHRQSFHQLSSLALFFFVTRRASIHPSIRSPSSPRFRRRRRRRRRRGRGRDAPGNVHERHRRARECEATRTQTEGAAGRDRRTDGRTDGRNANANANARTPTRRRRRGFGATPTTTRPASARRDASDEGRSEEDAAAATRAESVLRLNTTRDTTKDERYDEGGR